MSADTTHEDISQTFQKYFIKDNMEKKQRSKFLRTKANKNGSHGVIMVSKSNGKPLF